MVVKKIKDGKEQDTAISSGTDIDKKFLSGSLLLAAAGLKTGAAIGKTISDYGYLSYLESKTKSDIKIAENVNNLDEKAIAQNAAEGVAAVSRTFKKTAGKQSAAAAASGIDSGSGYVADLLLDSAKQADKDMTAILYNAQNAIDNKRLSLKLDKIQAKADLETLAVEKKETITAGIINSAVSLFEGVGNVANKWYDNKTKE
jgi:hypothetical protein